MTETYVKEEVAWRTILKVPLSNSFLERRDVRRKFSESLGAAPPWRHALVSGSHLDPKLTGNSGSGAVRAGKRRAWAWVLLFRLRFSRLKTTLSSSHAFSEYIYWPNSEREKKAEKRDRNEERERERKKETMTMWLMWLMMALTPKRLFLSFSLSLHFYLSSPPFSRAHYWVNKYILFRLR